MKKRCIEEEVDAVLHNEKNVKWGTKAIETYKSKMRSITGETLFFPAHSNDNINIGNIYLPGGILTMMWGNMMHLHEEGSCIMHRKGRHSSVILNAKRMRVLIINMHRLPDSSSDSPLKYKNQCDRIDGKMKTVKVHR